MPIRELTQVMARLASTVIAVLPAPPQYQAIQHQEMLEFFIDRDYNSVIELTEKVKAELNWWVQNIHLNKGRTLIPNPPQLIKVSDVSLKSWAGYF